MERVFGAAASATTQASGVDSANPALNAASRWAATMTRVREWVRPVLLPFLASRLLIICVILLSKLIVIPGPHAHRGGLLSVLVQWDGIWYLDIARHGYDDLPGGQQSMAFFPMYPLLIRALEKIFGDYALVSVVLSNACFLAAGVALFELVRARYGGKAAAMAVIFLMFNPAALFSTSAYPDSTFLLLAIGALLAATRRKWVLACVCGMLLAATRNVGIWIMLPLLIEHVQQVRESGDAKGSYLHPRLLWLALVPIGLLAFMCYGYVEFQNLLAFRDGARMLDTPLASPGKPIAIVPSHRAFYWWALYGSFAAAVLLWIAGIFLKLRLSWLAYAAALIVSFATATRLDAVPRSLGMVFPIFIVMGLIARRFKWTYEALLGASVALLALFTILAANGFWMR